MIHLENPKSILLVHGTKAYYSGQIRGNFADIDFYECDYHDAKSLNQKYDMVIVEKTQSLQKGKIEGLVKKLLAFTKTQVLLILSEKNTAFYSFGAGKKESYPPTVFCHLNFSYLSSERKSEWMLYSFFPAVKAGAHVVNRKTGSVKGALNIAYILPDQDLTGGMKQLLDQAREMGNRGHGVYLYLKDDCARSAIPEWSDLKEKDIAKQIVVPEDKSFSSYFESIDVIIAGWYEQIPELLNAKIPVALWEQGSSLLFGDFGMPVGSRSKALEEFERIYNSQIHLLSVSPLVQSILKARFDRESSLLSAGIDKKLYWPNPNKGDQKTILLVGNYTNRFKNFDVALDVLGRIKNDGYKFSVIWAGQTMPHLDETSSDLAINFHIMPSQADLASLYREADIFLSTSLYESFSLPPLEAMASGTAVVSTNNGGINTYGISGKNCIICEQDDTSDLVESLKLLLTDKDLKVRLIEEGLKTANRFSSESMAENLEKILYGIL